MSIGMVLLTVVAVLVFFGVAQRVLDKLYLSDRAALILIALMFFGTLIPNVTIGNVSVSIGGAVIPFGVCVYLLARRHCQGTRARHTGIPDYGGDHLCAFPLSARRAGTHAD